MTRGADIRRHGGGQMHKPLVEQVTLLLEYWAFPWLPQSCWSARQALQRAGQRE